MTLEFADRVASPTAVWPKLTVWEASLTLATTMVKPAGASTSASACRRRLGCAGTITCSARRPTPSSRPACWWETNSPGAAQCRFHQEAGPHQRLAHGQALLSGHRGLLQQIPHCKPNKERSQLVNIKILQQYKH